MKSFAIRTTPQKILAGRKRCLKTKRQVTINVQCHFFFAFNTIANLLFFSSRSPCWRQIYNNCYMLRKPSTLSSKTAHYGGIVCGFHTLLEQLHSNCSPCPSSPEAGISQIVLSTVTNSACSVMVPVLVTVPENDTLSPLSTRSLSFSSFHVPVLANLAV